MASWQKTLVHADATLEQAITAMDAAALRIVLVVDETQHLQGTLTDGDVRRALLRHMPMTAPASQAMNTAPQTARQDWSKSKILSVMEAYKLLQLPVVDADNRVIGLQDLHDLLDKQRHDNPVLLMAGGFGTRLRPLTNNCPKPLLKVGNKPILETILDSFVDAGFHRFYISTHYMPDAIRDYFGDGSQWGVTIAYIHEEEPLGTGGALGLLPHDAIDLPLFVMNCDLLTTLDFHSLLSFHKAHDSIATMCVHEYEYQVPYGVVTNNGDYIESMTEKPTQTFFVNTGIYVLQPELVKSVTPQSHVDMPTLLERQMATGERVSMFPLREYWLDVGKMEDFRRAQVDASDILAR